MYGLLKGTHAIFSGNYNASPCVFFLEENMLFIWYKNNYTLGIVNSMWLTNQNM